MGLEVEQDSLGYSTDLLAQSAGLGNVLNYCRNSYASETCCQTEEDIKRFEAMRCGYGRNWNK